MTRGRTSDGRRVPTGCIGEDDVTIPEQLDALGLECPKTREYEHRKYNRSWGNKSAVDYADAAITELSGVVETLVSTDAERFAIAMRNRAEAAEAERDALKAEIERLAWIIADAFANLAARYEKECEG